LKIAIPSLGNQAIILLKDSSLASVIALAELLMVAKRYGSRHFTFLEFFLVAALIYLVLTTFFNMVISTGERLFSAEHRRASPKSRTRPPSVTATNACWEGPGDGG